MAQYDVRRHGNMFRVINMQTEKTYAFRRFRTEAMALALRLNRLALSS